MTPDTKPQSHAPTAFRISRLWDIYVPLMIGVLPAGIFALLGLVTKGMGKPGVEPPTWATVMMAVLQTLGIIAMAVVILKRFDSAMRQLSLSTHGHPAVWRKCVLFPSIVWILLFELLTNVAAAFAGAEQFFVAAIPAFVGYIICRRIAFARL